MHNKNVWIIIGIAALIALAAALGLLLPRRVQVEADAPSLTDAQLAVITPSGESLTPEPAAAQPTFAATAAPAGTAAPKETAVPTEEPASAETATPIAGATPGVSAAVGPVATPAVKAYLLVTVHGVVYQPIPLTEEGEYTVKQGTSGMENVIHVTPTSVNMKSATCDNQDCVQQGVVTLENMEQRILGNMIICLPNEVTLELYTPEGLMQLLRQQ